MATASTHPGTTEPDLRIGRMLDELRAALAEVPRAELSAWGSRSAKRLGSSAARRVVRLGGLAKTIGTALWTETTTAIGAHRQGVLQQHLKSRAGAAGTAGLSAAKSAATASRDFVAVVPKLATEPQEAAPVLAGAVLGFVVGSGGLDADGGVPDLDFLGGIGAHRSIFTHSIIAGIAVEGLVLALLDLVGMAHQHLPATHDPLWDSLIACSERFANTFVGGVSAGMAYHLAMDVTLDGFTPYKDLPVHLPMEGHRALLGANAVAEGLDVSAKRKK